jgi:hypothetical protein
MEKEMGKVKGMEKEMGLVMEKEMEMDQIQQLGRMAAWQYRRYQKQKHHASS